MLFMGVGCYGNTFLCIPLRNDYFETFFEGKLLKIKFAMISPQCSVRIKYCLFQENVTVWKPCGAPRQPSN